MIFNAYANGKYFIVKKNLKNMYIFVYYFIDPPSPCRMDRIQTLYIIILIDFMCVSILKDNNVSSAFGGRF